MSIPSKSTIKRRLKQLRTLIDESSDPAEQRIAYGMETAIRWATENTVDWKPPHTEAICLAALLHKEWKP